VFQILPRGRRIGIECIPIGRFLRDCSKIAQLLLSCLQQFGGKGEGGTFAPGILQLGSLQGIKYIAHGYWLFFDPKSHSRSHILIPLLLRLQMGIEFEQRLSCFPRVEFA
jgi:hypothetical protein